MHDKFMNQTSGWERFYAFFAGFTWIDDRRVLGHEEKGKCERCGVLGICVVGAGGRQV